MGLLNFEWIGGQKRAQGATPLLAVESVSVRLGQRHVLDDVNLEVYEGEQVRITGPNGAGKSTLLNAIMGVVPLASGRIAFKGKDISQLPTHERAQSGIRYMRQRDNVLPSLTVRENLRLALGSDGYERFRKQFPEWAKDIVPDTPPGMLSGGQKQKLAWGMTVLSQALLFLVDEPSAGVAGSIMFPSVNAQIASLWIEHE